MAPPSNDVALTVDERVAQDLEAFVDHCSGEACTPPRPDGEPDVQMPASTARINDPTEEEVRTLGLTLRWDPGTSRYDIDRGNTPTWNGP
jgi:hypothetical protein